jgi:hypothetical protein
LPSGVTLDAVSGRLAGVPTAWGTTTAVVEAHDSWRTGRTDSRALTITIQPSLLSITTTSLNAGVYNTMYRFDLQASGGTGSTSWSLAGGTLPVGLTLDANGTLSGVPASAGSTVLTVKATDVKWPGNSATAALSLTIQAPVFAITLPPSPSARVGQSYQLKPVATGNVGTVVWSIASGSLPAGLTLSSSTGTIAGTPTVWGTSTLSVRATDTWQAGRTDVEPLTIVVAPVALTISTTTLPTGVYHKKYRATLIAKGGTGTVTWSLVSGALPRGLALNALTGEIRGTPSETIRGTPSEIGSFAFAVKAVDSNWKSDTATKTLTLVVAVRRAPQSVP